MNEKQVRKIPKFKPEDVQGILTDGRQFVACRESYLVENGVRKPLMPQARDLNGHRVVFVPTGEFRAPKRDEFYLSGAPISAYRAFSDLTMEFWIAEPIAIRTVTTHHAEKIFL